MTIYEILKHEIAQLNTIRLPISEAENIRRIGAVVQDLNECVKAIEIANRPKEEEPENAIVEPEKTEDDSES